MGIPANMKAPKTHMYYLVQGNDHTMHDIKSRSPCKNKRPTLVIHKWFGSVADSIFVVFEIQANMKGQLLLTKRTARSKMFR